MRRSWILASSLAMAAIVATGATLVFGVTPPSQPIDFSHLTHTQELGMECVECHQHVTSGYRATIPNLPVCADCHDTLLTESPAEAVLLASIESGAPIRWFRVTSTPGDVYFSHRRHTALAEISCATCHGDVATLEQPLTRPLVEMTMDDCIDCHEQRGVTNDCISCHR